MTAFIVDWIARGGYWGIAALMVLENVIPPIPSEIIMGLGGIAVARGDMQFVQLLLDGTAGTVVGNLFWYEVGRRLGYRRLRPLVDRYGRWLTLDWDEVERLNGFLARRGEAVVFVFRFMPAFRTMISLPAGMMGMPIGRFMLWTAAGSTIWNTALIGAGMWLGGRLAAIDAVLGPAGLAMTAAMIGWYVWRVATWRRDRSETEAPRPPDRPH